VLLKLEKLRLSRRHLSEGNSVPPQIVLLSDMIQEAHKQTIAEKQAMQKAKSREQQKQLETFTKNIESGETKDEEDQEQTVQLDEAQMMDPKLQVLRFYYQAFESLDKLINIRQNWDSYIIPPHTGGSRVPQFYPSGARNLSPLWQQFVIKPES